MVVRQHDLIAIQLRTAAAGQAPPQRYTAARGGSSALDAGRRRSYPSSPDAAYGGFERFNVRLRCTSCSFVPASYITIEVGAGVPKLSGAQQQASEGAPHGRPQTRPQVHLEKRESRIVRPPELTPR